MASSTNQREVIPHMQHSPESIRDHSDSWPVHRAVCDVFVKIGGSILDHDSATAALAPRITGLCRQQRILILTGGGQAAKRVKMNQIRVGGDFYRFWRATGLFPEVNAYLLASYSTAFTVVSCAAEIAECLTAGNIPVFAPAGAILNSLYFLPDWLVTTDSMGLYFASLAGARRYVIVSDVDGIYDRKPGEGTCGSPIPCLNIDDLERLSSSKLDQGFTHYFHRYPLPTVVVNGNHPDRVAAAICGAPTIGTEILVPRAASAGKKQCVR